MPAFVAFVIVMVALVTVLSLRHTMRRHQRIAAVLESVSSSVGGRVQAGHWLTAMPVLHFRVRELAAWLELTSSGGKHPVLYTEITVKLGGVDVLPLRLAPEGFLTKVGKLFGLQDVEVGDKAFDAAFSIATSSPGPLTRFLSPSVRQMILRLRALGGGFEQLWIEVESGRFFIRKHSWIEEEWQLRQFLVTSVQIVEAYLETIGLRQLSPPAPERCPVCKDRLGERVEVCRWCGVKHHPECFELNDGCGRCGAKAEAAPLSTPRVEVE